MTPSWDANIIIDVPSSSNVVFDSIKKAIITVTVISSNATAFLFVNWSTFSFPGSASLFSNVHNTAIFTDTVPLFAAIPFFAKVVGDSNLMFSETYSNVVFFVRAFFNHSPISLNASSNGWASVTNALVCWATGIGAVLAVITKVAELLGLRAIWFSVANWVVVSVVTFNFSPENTAFILLLKLVTAAFVASISVDKPGRADSFWDDKAGGVFVRTLWFWAGTFKEFAAAFDGTSLSARCAAGSGGMFKPERWALSNVALASVLVAWAVFWGTRDESSFDGGVSAVTTWDAWAW